MAHRCYIGTRSQPVRSPSAGPCCMLPCESSLESTRRLLCMYVWSTSPAHLFAFVCICVHFGAFCAFSRIHKSGSSAVVNWNTNLCKIMRINASWSECIRMQLICMLWNARKCITFRMHPYGNAHECIMGRMHRNATHVNALKCVYMHHVQNAYIR